MLGGKQTFQLLWLRNCRRPIIKILLLAAPYTPGKSWVCKNMLSLIYCCLLSIPLGFPQFSCFSLRCGRTCTRRSQRVTTSPYSVCSCDYQSPSAKDGTEMPLHNITSLAHTRDQCFNQSHATPYLSWQTVPLGSCVVRLCKNRTKSWGFFPF